MGGLDSPDHGDTSQSPQPDRKSVPTPQQLNAKLNDTVNHFPQFSMDELTESSDEEFLDRFDKRRNSEYTQQLVNNCRELVEQAPTTESFRKFVIILLESAAWVGVRQTEWGSGSPLFFLDHDLEDSGGIFDPARAKQLERIAIAIRARSIVNLSNTLTRIRREEGIGEDHVPDREEIDKWKVEFKEKYGEEV